MQTTQAIDQSKRALAAFRLHRRAVRQQEQTETLCASIGITWRDHHPLAHAILEAADRVRVAEANLRDALSKTPAHEVVDGDHFARLGELDRDGYPAVVVGRVDALAEIIQQWEPAL